MLQTFLDSIVLLCSEQLSHHLMDSALFGQDVGLDGKAHYLKSPIPNFG